MDVLHPRCAGLDVHKKTVVAAVRIVEHGKVIDGFANSELSANMDKLHTYLGV